MKDKDLAALQQRNAERAAATIEKMGSRYACHHTNLVKKDPVRTRFAPVTETKVQSSPVVLLRRNGVK